MNAICDTVVSGSADFRSCKESDNGARVRTTCIFPSFEPVFVYVVRFGDGFVVHEAGETMAVILSHGQDGSVASRVIRTECKRFDLTFEGRRISVKIDAPEWLDNAIVAVANTAAMAAYAAVSDSSRKREHELADTLFDLLTPRLPRGSLVKDYDYHGASGRRYRFDLAVQARSGLSLIQTIRPNANSVNAKYVALADVPDSDEVQRIAAHAGDLAPEDILLLQNVATVATAKGVATLLGASNPPH